MTSKVALGISGALVAVMGAVGAAKYVHANDAYENTLEARSPALLITGVTPEFTAKTRAAFEAADAAFDASWNNWPVRAVPSTEAVLAQKQQEEAARQAAPHQFLEYDN